MSNSIPAPPSFADPCRELYLLADAHADRPDEISLEEVEAITRRIIEGYKAASLRACAPYFPDPQDHLFSIPAHRFALDVYRTSRMLLAIALGMADEFKMNPSKPEVQMFELGCGTGLLVQAFTCMDPRSYSKGFEYNADAYIQARRFFDEVNQGQVRVEQRDLLQFPPRKSADWYVHEHLCIGLSHEDPTAIVRSTGLHDPKRAIPYAAEPLLCLSEPGRMSDRFFPGRKVILADRSSRAHANLRADFSLEPGQIIVPGIGVNVDWYHSPRTGFVLRSTCEENARLLRSVRTYDHAILGPSFYNPAWIEPTENDEAFRLSHTEICLAEDAEGPRSLSLTLDYPLGYYARLPKHNGKLKYPLLIHGDQEGVSIKRVGLKASQ